MRSSDDSNTIAEERDRRLQGLAEEIESIARELAHAEGIQLVPGAPFLTSKVLKVIGATRRETDAGAALIGAAFLHGELLALLKLHCVDDEKVQRRVLGSDQYEGLLGTFHGQIELAFLIGLIPAQIRHDLDLIRKIRNRFAHHPDTLTFEDEKIRGWCASFTLESEPPTSTPRERFTRSALDIGGSIQFLLASQKRRTVPMDLPKAGSEEVVRVAHQLFDEFRRRNSR